MRLVAITDLHGNLEMVEKFSRKLSAVDFDALLIAGDVTNFSGAETARRILRHLLELGKPIIAVHGNCDGRDVPELLEELGISVHNKRVELNGLGVVGVGGSNITPFNTIWELTEEEIHGILERNYQKGDVILSHAPPYNTVTDKVRSGLHVGSKALRSFIEERQPPLVICGHIHEARGVDRIGEIPVINPGPLFKGYYAIIEIGEEINARLERL